MNCLKKLATGIFCTSMFLGAFAAPVFADTTDEPSTETGDKEKTTYPGMDKTIIDGEGKVIDASTVEVGDKVTFKLESNVPDNLFKYFKFESEGGKVSVTGDYILTMHDDMSEGFVMDEESINVKLVRKDGTTKGITTYTKGKCDDCDFHIALDLKELYNDGVIEDVDVREASKLVVTYNATLTTDPTPGKHTNKAWVTSKEPSIEDIVEVDVFGIKVLKIDAENNEKVLEGATFELYDHIKDPTKEETPIATKTTDGKGELNFDGLKAGTYYLYETAAPDGYILSKDPVMVVVNGEKAGTDFIVDSKVANSTAPETGGMGTAAFTMGGAALLGAAAVVMIYKKKKESDAE